MATFDSHKNFAISTVVSPPSPATSGTSLTVAAGAGANFPAAPFNAVVFPANTQYPTLGNGEIVRVTAVSTDTFTITRTQEGTNARSIVQGDIIFDAITVKSFTDIENALNSLEPSLGNPSTNGYVLSSTTAGVRSWIAAGSGSGTVTSVSVVSANGLGGTVATATTTPAITLTTSITGILKGNGTAISAGVSGTDYSPGTSALTTGILKSTTSTGALSIAVAGDFPTLNQNTTGTSSNITGVAAIANGGTGQTTQQTAMNALAGTQVSGKYLRSDGTNTTLSSISAGDVPTLNQNTTGTSANVTGIVGVANGGTGESTAFTQGSVVFAGASGVYSQDNGNLFWDDTNKRLGIGTSTPNNSLSILLAGGVTEGVFGQYVNTAEANQIKFGIWSNTYGAKAFIEMAGIVNGSDTDGIITLLTTHAGIGQGERMRIDRDGKVGIGTSAPSALLSVGSSSQFQVDGSGNATLSGVLKLNGSTSGTVTLKPQAVAGTWTLQLPTTAGTSGYVLSTDGTGITNWVAPGGSSAWSVLTAPTANLSLSMAAYTSTFTSNATTSTGNIWTFTDTANNTGTGNLVTIGTASGSSAIPLLVNAKGSQALQVNASGVTTITQLATKYSSATISTTTQTVDFSGGNTARYILGANVTFTFTNPTDQAHYTIELIQDATGSRTVTWPASVVWAGGTTPTLTTTANYCDIFTFIYDGTLSKYRGTATLNFSA